MDIVPNLLAGKDLLENIGTVSYDASVTEDQFWKTVGERLAARRRRHISMAAMLQSGGPTNKTIQEIEAGNIKQLSTLRDYARVVGVDLVDLFRTVLTEDEDEHSEELQFVVRQFRTGGVDGRQAFVSTAKVVERAQQVQRTHPEPDAMPGTPRAPRATAKRRAVK